MQIRQLITFIAAICMHSDELTGNYSVPSGYCQRTLQKINSRESPATGCDQSCFCLVIFINRKSDSPIVSVSISNGLECTRFCISCRRQACSLE